MTSLQNPPQTLRPRRKAKNWSLQRIFIVAVAIFGVGVLLYPTAARWFSDRAHATEINGYISNIEALPSDKLQALLTQARDYNAALPAGPLRDPYSLNEKGEQIGIGAGAQAYEETLSVNSGGVMGNISIPSIKANLPIFHGTDEATLAKGVGHLFGSSLPVGGIDTHSVLTAHSGFVKTTLFDHLNKVAKDDVFSVTVLNETIYYKVDQILTVVPEDTEALRQVKGKDYITLVTCTPTGINSHRLLVRGERIPAPEASDTSQTLPGHITDPGFPWWALVLVGTTVTIILLTRPRHSKPTPQDKATTA